MEQPRWHLRHDNLKSALNKLLTEAIDGLRAGRLSMLEREGLIQRFEYSWELGWKTMRDYLRATGAGVAVPVPTNVIRAAFAVGLIADGDAWIEAKNARNAMAHEYDRLRADEVAAAIRDRFHPLLLALDAALDRERSIGN
ncbi:hypothetical protein ASG29_11405 [Sphingomonas sp. Leaf412]|uniref:HI0074 family nucleotidyltransferase substrate-binding subunit n=1 Tax=Sphingomonas sp. Leaf412 TaxID=1736370 RepID=UPI0006F922B1|nr:HI0074 family nucleotidyltransferase substrate-binding subunit [Sphingomonas sp. Leaf412]KQT32390.1 hypothetical protein ASG29_11405 [Sphingomonas sp. Leaf412]